MNPIYRELVKGAYKALIPPAKQTVSQWADENRVLVSESTAETGAWHTDRAPYQREIMDAFTQAGVWQIAIMAGSQVGKTEMILNMMGRAIHLDPGPMLFIQPTDGFAEDFSKRRVSPMISACRALNSLVNEAKSRDTGNTIGYKQFPGGSVTFTGANSPTELAGRPIRYLFADEIDRFPVSAGTEGNPLKLAERRTETFRQNRRVVMTSTPTVKGASNIERVYKEGTQEEYHTLCPQCQSYHYIVFNDIRFEKSEYKDEYGDVKYKVSDVRWRCPKCGNEIGEFETKHQPAKWVAKNPKALDEGMRSFVISCFMSPWSDWKDICKKFLDAKEDPELLKVFHNTMLGELWEVKDRSGAPEKLFRRREDYDGEIPTGVCVLTMGLDTQDNRIEYEVTGWNRDEESWGIEKGIIPGRPDTPEVWQEIDRLLDREWSLSNGNKIRIMGSFMDSGGHCTTTIYRECAKRRSKKLWAIKGEGGANKQDVRWMKNAKSDDGAVKFLVGVDPGKEAIYYNAGVDEPGPRYMHYPSDYRCGYDEEYFRGLFSERQVMHRRQGQTVIVWEKMRERNEPLDLRVYNRAVFKFFRWDFNGLERVLYHETEQTEVKARKRRTKVSAGITI